MSGFTFGADPEVFITKKGKPISAYGLVEGTKSEPKKTPNGAYQVDGMALEFNIDPTPQNDFERFNLNIVNTIRDMRVAAGEGVNFSKVCVQDFDPEYLEAQPKEAKELGCDPDYSAYTLKANPRPDGEKTFRTGAGHIHIGWGADIPVENEEHMKICAGFVKALDYTVGLFMTYIDREPRRRELYGKAGAFRPKPYGVEYRTPSNAWIWNRSRRRIMWALMNTAIAYHRQGYTADRVIGISQDAVQEIIDTGDWKSAKTFVDQYFTYHQDAAIWKAIKKEMEKFDGAED